MLAYLMFTATSVYPLSTGTMGSRRVLEPSAGLTLLAMARSALKLGWWSSIENTLSLASAVLRRIRRNISFCFLWGRMLSRLPFDGHHSLRGRVLGSLEGERGHKGHESSEGADQSRTHQRHINDMRASWHIRELEEHIDNFACDGLERRRSRECGEERRNKGRTIPRRWDTAYIYCWMSPVSSLDPLSSASEHEWLGSVSRMPDSVR
jgi:hypothetical protein